MARSIVRLFATVGGVASVLLACSQADAPTTSRTSTPATTVSQPTYQLASINGTALPAPVCSPGTTCPYTVVSAAITVVSDSQLHYVEHYRPTASTTDSVRDVLLTYWKDKNGIGMWFVQHGHDSAYPRMVDTGVTQASGQIKIATWRNPNRFDFLYTLQQ